MTSATGPNMGFQDVLMVKFYVVDGISYPACETAIGIFGRRGYQAMKVCRALGFQDASAKNSLPLHEFRRFLSRKGVDIQTSSEGEGLEVAPLDYYLAHRGFRASITPEERTMAQLYLVDGLTYTDAERRVGLSERLGFQAMYAVCKCGAFRGAAERGTMTLSEFDQRMDALRLGRPT